MFQMTSRAPKPVSAQYQSQTLPRKSSLKEMPSYLKEVSVALNRREELLKLRERMSSAKIILEKDPSAKPWLLSRSISNNSIKDETPKMRKISRGSSRDTETSSEHSEDWGLTLTSGTTILELWYQK